MSTKYVLDPADRRRLLASPAGWLACGFGSGLTPKAQGTFGSLAALLPWCLLRDLSVPAWLGVIVLSFAIGVWACDVAGRILGVADHRSLVWDEFVGQWIALLPALLAPWWAVLAGFVLFRLFDVWKPWPIGWFDRRVKGGFGVMLDDAIAGLFAAIVLFLVLRLAT
ncbi:phosphatidylglycerophosphatase A family protein [Luteibacter sp. UNCMF366Tsu5.1]|uniref:phosphatidylglycerophosphatase A family protein n=1 Tax=Luteibacter sp. UNCMF366Tsu5.1 TaxID=1502758 RepID=UPI000908E1B8|nr:phosphatidylglycerophosphatase A [Luteibacter sp. UNCMF366Tsu5.1]SFW58041.1 phosphatidylglycerophosphatase A [Luteibacter sp. UNCMF366Tsu5.1]